MSLELNLRFSGADRVEVRLGGEESGGFFLTCVGTWKRTARTRWVIPMTSRLAM